MSEDKNVLPHLLTHLSDDKDRVHLILAFSLMLLSGILKAMGVLNPKTGKEKRNYSVPHWLDLVGTFITCIILFFISSPLLHSFQIKEEAHYLIVVMLGLLSDEALKGLYKISNLIVKVKGMKFVKILLNDVSAEQEKRLTKGDDGE